MLSKGKFYVNFVSCLQRTLFIFMVYHEMLNVF